VPVTSTHFDSTEEKDDTIQDVDDTDGVDPAAEFEAWRLRELGRIKKEKDEEIRREKNTRKLNDGEQCRRTED